MNPYLIIAALAAVMGAGWGGFRLGVDHEKAGQVDKLELVAEAVDAANQSAAKAIAKLIPKNVTIRQTLEKEIHENTVYRDCKSSQAAVDAFNSGIVGVQQPGDGAASKGNPAGGIKLPATNATH
jgi:glutamine synthetase